MANYTGDNALRYLLTLLKPKLENQGSGGIEIGDTAPPDTTIAWIDTKSGGILKYHNGTDWVPVKSVWG